ncbi:MAG: hypothetical protein RL538_349 [Candidatus Parcubacteria bacterium]
MKKSREWLPATPLPLRRRNSTTIGRLLELAHETREIQEPDEPGARIELPPFPSEPPVSRRHVVVGVPCFPDSDKPERETVEPAEVSGIVVDPCPIHMASRVHDPGGMILDHESSEADNEQSTDDVAEIPTDESWHDEGHQRNEPRDIAMVPPHYFVGDAALFRALEVPLRRWSESRRIEEPPHVRMEEAIEWRVRIFSPDIFPLMVHEMLRTPPQDRSLSHHRVTKRECIRHRATGNECLMREVAMCPDRDGQVANKEVSNCRHDDYERGLCKRIPHPKQPQSVHQHEVGDVWE